jgi:hypothetical protein
MEGLCGLMAIDTNAGVAVNTVEELNPPELAVTVVVPKAREVANPVEFTVATEFADELQFDLFVRSAMLPSV